MLIIDEAKMLKTGLSLVGHSLAGQGKCRPQQLETRFRSVFGKSAKILLKLWIDLQTTNIAAAKIVDAVEKDLHKFLWTLNWMTEYATEASMTGRTGWCEKTIRKEIKSIIYRIQAFKESKIIWPASWDDPLIDSPVFICSVDGTHCPIQEPTRNHKYSKNPKYYSHKFNRSALAYEVALSLFTSHIVWINGPFPAGKKDPEIFKEPNGLCLRIPQGKKVIADSAYKRQEFPMISVTNVADSSEVKLFKRRVRAPQPRRAFLPK